MRSKAMAEIIIIGIFAVSAVLAAVLAVHNVQELSDARARYDAMQKDRNELAGAKKIIELENEVLTAENNDLAELVASLNKENRALFDELQKARETPKNQDTVGTSQRENAHLERLPEGVATNRYDCEGFSFPEGTAQYKLQQLCTNDWETGIRIFTRDNIRYRCVAMGTAYGIDIGDAWEVTLRNGYTFPVVLADYQHDISFIDPNDFGERFVYDDNWDIIDNLRNYDGDPVVHVLEFIADLDAMPQAAKDAGGMHGLTIFGGKYGPGGNIVNLKYLGRVWEP